MRTLYYNHPDFQRHDTGAGHPERAARLKAIDQALAQAEFAGLIRVAPPMGTEQQVQLIHPAAHIQHLRAALPTNGTRHLSADTVLSPDSLTAAFRAVGAVCDAVDRVMGNTADNAFCAVRPPGHHAEPMQAMGFCLFNNIAIAAEHARQHYHLQRIAIVDFDVHHGNGTQAAFYHQPQVLYASSHEMPHYPGTGDPSETGAGNMINVPLTAGDTGVEFRAKYQSQILPALEHFKPQLLLVSAGFDAHSDDPLSGIRLIEDDYRWVTLALKNIAERHCQGRLVSVLEGGYNLKALGECVTAHVGVLMGIKV
ncbi:MAG: histone deacetylase family protein [Methylovulum sp.]|uniref:histone deacetylase family protein n=1 Tax=Methylovulum sp. TaxID=1916980 RepID=UPI0026156909|nr:histone deacetylase family protein [Methylovulum sp.]MDD2722874.1 histone deacetylase family protein [Methylovulum sp.]